MSPHYSILTVDVALHHATSWPRRESPRLEEETPLNTTKSIAKVTKILFTLSIMATLLLNETTYQFTQANPTRNFIKLNPNVKKYPCTHLQGHSVDYSKEC